MVEPKLGEIVILTSARSVTYALPPRFGMLRWGFQSVLVHPVALRIKG